MGSSKFDLNSTMRCLDNVMDVESLTKPLSKGKGFPLRYQVPMKVAEPIAGAPSYRSTPDSVELMNAFSNSYAKATTHTTDDSSICLPMDLSLIHI